MSRSPATKKIWLIGGSLAIIVFVLGLRLLVRPSSPPPLPPTPPSQFERFLTFRVVLQNLDPGIVEREQGVFEGTAKALRENPDFFEGWMTLASIKKQMGDFPGAAEIWEHAGGMRPLNSVSFNNLGDLYANFLNEYAQAEKNFRRAITNAAGEEKQQHYFTSLYELYRYRFKDDAQALAILEEGAAANPWSRLLQMKAAQFAAATGQRAKALAYYQAALKLDPKNDALAEEYRRYRDQQ